MSRSDRFAGRACLVTGATGMAAAVAAGLAAEGGRVFIVSRTAAHAHDLAARIAAAGGASAWRAADLTDEAAVDEAVAACVEAYGRLDAVASFAGISARRYGDGPLHAATLAGWEAVVATNLTSMFLVARAAIRAMLASPPGAGGGRGSLLLMSSQLARHPAATHFATHGYAATKGGIEALARAAAATYAPMGIRVNVIAPSLVATPMSHRAQDDPAIRAYLADKQPLAGGPIAPDDVVGAALFLLSDEARMVTGQVLAIDAGWAVSEPGPGTTPPSA